MAPKPLFTPLREIDARCGRPCRREMLGTVTLAIGLLLPTRQLAPRAQLRMADGPPARRTMAQPDPETTPDDDTFVFDMTFGKN